MNFCIECIEWSSCPPEEYTGLREEERLPPWTEPNRYLSWQEREVRYRVYQERTASSLRSKYLELRRRWRLRSRPVELFSHSVAELIYYIARKRTTTPSRIVSPTAHPVSRRFNYMLRPTVCQMCFALPCQISQTKPTVSRRSSPTCILSVPRTAKRHGVVPPTNQSTSSFSVWIQASQVVPYRSCFDFDGDVSVLRPSDILLSTAQPESTPRVSYPTTLVFTDRRLSVSRSCVGGFQVFPCRLWEGSGLLSPRSNRSPSQRTALAGGDSS